MSKKIFLSLFFSAIFCHAQDFSQNLILDMGKKKVEKIVVEDLNNDRLLDLLVSFDKEIGIFYQYQGGRFSSSPEQVVKFPPDTFIWCLSSMGDSRALFFHTSKGILVSVFEEKKFRNEPVELILHPTYFSQTTAPIKPFYVDFCVDLNGDKKTDIIFFAPHQLYVFYQTEKAKFKLVQKIPLPADTHLIWFRDWYMSRIFMCSHMPLLIWGDFNGDERIDIGFYMQDEIFYYSQGEDGTFANEPVRNLLLLKKRKKSRTFFTIDVSPIITDINDDKALDIVLPIVSKGRVYILYSMHGHFDASRADVRDFGGPLWEVNIVDLDADGKKEMIVTKLPRIDVLRGLQIFLTQKIPLNIHFFKFERDGFSKSSVKDIQIEAPFVLFGSMEAASLDMRFKKGLWSDFSRDGRRDMWLLSPDNNVSIFFFKEGEFFSEYPDIRFSLSPPSDAAYVNSVLTYDLNQDGFSDFIFTFADEVNKRYWFEIRIAR